MSNSNALTKKLCSKCGAISTSEVNYCRQCGALLKALNDDEATALRTRPVEVSLLRQLNVEKDTDTKAPFSISLPFVLPGKSDILSLLTLDIFSTPKPDIGGLAKATRSELSLEFESDDVGILEALVDFGSRVGAVAAASPEEREALMKKYTKERSSDKATRIPISKIESVNLKVRWFKTKVIIRVKTMALFKKVPRSSRGQVELQVARADREIAEKFVSFLNSQMRALS